MREGLNLTHEKLAKLLVHYSEDDIKKWELNITSIPAEAVFYVENLHNMVEHISNGSAMEFKNSDEKELCIIKYINDEDFLYADQLSYTFFKCHEVHFVLTQKFAAKIEKYGISIRIVNFDRVKYTAWLEENNYSHSPHRRDEWIRSKKHFPISLGQQVSMDKLLSDINCIILELKETLSLKIKIRPNQFICSKVEIFKNAILFGILELAEETLLLYQRGKFIPSSILARSVYERYAVLYGLRKLIIKSIEEDTLSKANEELNKLFGGSRLRVGEVEYQSPNILTFIEKLEKEFFSDTPIKFIYDTLSNYSHPNYEGVWDAYVIFNEEHVELHSHDKGNIKNIILITLFTALSMTLMLNDELNSLLPEYTKKYFPSLTTTL